MANDFETPSGVFHLADAEPDTEFTLTISVEDALNVLEDGLANDSLSDLNSAATNLFGLLIDAAQTRCSRDAVTADRQAVERLTGIIGEAVHFLSSGHGITVIEGQKQLHSMLDGNEAGLYVHALKRDEASQAALGRVRALAARWGQDESPYGALLLEAMGSGTEGGPGSHTCRASTRKNGVEAQDGPKP